MLADDHAIIRQGLCALLNADGRFWLVGEARTGREAVEMARTLRPDVILMDIAMPVLNGVEATRQILAANPAAKVIIVSAHSEEEYVERTSRAGVAGFIEKQAPIEMLIAAIRLVAEGKTFFSPAIAKRLPKDSDKSQGQDGLLNLTSRQAEVLQLTAEGLCNKQVAAKLGISIKTVEKHRQQLMDKLNIHNIAGLTRYAIGAGVIESSVQLNIV